MENEHFDNVSQHLLVKLEEQEVGDNSDERKHLPSHIQEQDIDHDNKQAIEQISRSLVSSLTPVSLHDFSMASPFAISHRVTKLDNARSWNPCPCNIHAKVCHINKLLPRS